MFKLKIVASLIVLFSALAGMAQTSKAPSKKASNPDLHTPAKKAKNQGVKAHRGTILLSLHEKVTRNAQLRYAALPKIGTLVNELPKGSVTLMKDSIFYFYKNGFFYLQNKKAFQTILPPAGLRIQGLPLTYRRVAVGETAFFYFHGVFYAQVGSTDSYDVIVAPETAIVDALPDGYTVQKIDGVEYFLLGDVYFAEVDAPNLEGKIGYEVVTIIQAY